MPWSCTLDAATARRKRSASASTASAARRSRTTVTSSRSTMSAGPTAMPGETPMPVSCTAPHASSPKPLDTSAARASIAAFSSSPSRRQLQPGPLPRGQQQDAQDRLAVHDPVVPAHRHPRAELAGRVHEASGGARVHAQPVADHDLPVHHGRFSSTSLAT